jgi:hypothetical protein
VDGIHAELLGAFRPVVRTTAPLDVEVLAFGVLGSWWQRPAPGEDADGVLGEGVIRHAARAGTPEALARVLAVLSPRPSASGRRGGADSRRCGRPAPDGQVGAAPH